MSKQIKKIKIIDNHTIELDENASSGDRIDLNDIDIKNIDTSIIAKRIDEGNDAVYNNKLGAAKAVLKLEITREYVGKIEEQTREIAVLNEKIENTKKQTRLEVENLYKDQINDLNNNKVKLSNDKDREINDLKNQLRNANESVDAKIAIAVQAEQLKHKDQFALKEKEINDLTTKNAQLSLARSAQSTKRQGEQLEKWCNSEFNSYSMAFPNCVWKKDTKSVRGEDGSATKSDYLFEVYSDSNFSPVNLLTKVALEMKTEDPNSQTNNRTSNASHISKLIGDMERKNAEYGLLVSELEWNTENDPLLQKVQGYNNVFIVRPPYFVPFLSVINSLALKYKDITEQMNKERIEFKEAREIREEFDKMKDEILDNSVKNLEKNLNELIANHEKLGELVSKNKDILDKALNRHTKTIINKIEGFNIKKIITRLSDN